MSTIVINGTEHEVQPMRAKQYAILANILGKMAQDGRKVLKGMGADTTGADLLWAILASINEQELLKLAAISLGTTEEFAKENFALDWVTEALSIQIEQANVAAIIRNFLRLSTLIQ